MSELESLAARLLCVGFTGNDPEAIDTDDLAELGPGGLILFARNVTTPERTRALVAHVAGAIEVRSGRRPYVAVDQEGGRVARFRAGAVAVPSAMAIGAAGREDLAERAGRALAADVRRFGCDVDFAPVLDLALRAESRVVGSRSFGDDPVRAGKLGGALVRGMRAGGVAAVVKHAPGHGATGVDSHEALPVLDADATTLAARDLTPFDYARAAGARGAMLAHVVVPGLGERPASLNPAVIALVRASAGADTWLVTDCLQMAAISKSFGSAEAAALAIRAGADGAIVSHDPLVARAAAAAIARDVDAGRIPRTRFDEALASTERFRIHVAAIAAQAPAAIPTIDAGEKTALEIARAAVTTLRDGPAAWLECGDAVSVVSFEGGRLASAEGQGLVAGIPAPSAEQPSLGLALRRRKIRAEMLRVPLAPSESEIAALELVLEAQSDRALIVIVRGARHEPAQARAVARLVRLRPRATIVCAAEPFDLAVLDDAARVLCTYGDGSAECEALADVLTGRAATPGASPVVLLETRSRS